MTDAGKVDAERLFSGAKFPVATEVKRLARSNEVMLIEISFPPSEVIQYQFPLNDDINLRQNIGLLERGEAPAEWQAFRLNQPKPLPSINKEHDLHANGEFPILPANNLVIARAHIDLEDPQGKKEFERTLDMLADIAQHSQFDAIAITDGNPDQIKSNYRFPIAATDTWARRISPQSENLIIIFTSPKVESPEVRVWEESLVTELNLILREARDKRFSTFESGLLNPASQGTEDLFWGQLRGGLLGGEYRTEMFLEFSGRYLDKIYGAASLAELNPDQLMIGAEIEELQNRIISGRTLNKTEADNPLLAALSKYLRNPDAPPEWRNVSEAYDRCNRRDCSAEDLLLGYDGAISEDLPSSAVRYAYIGALANKLARSDSPQHLTKDDLMHRLFNERDATVKSLMALAWARSLPQKPDNEVYDILMGLAAVEPEGINKGFYWVAAREALVGFGDEP